MIGALRNQAPPMLLTKRQTLRELDPEHFVDAFPLNRMLYPILKLRRRYTNGTWIFSLE
jgi:hypothetical protein